MKPWQLNKILQMNEKLIAMADGGKAKGGKGGLGKGSSGKGGKGWQNGGNLGQGWGAGTGGNGECSRCGKKGHYASQCPLRIHGYVCKTCHHEGHHESMCKTPAAAQKNEADKKKDMCLCCGGEDGHKKKECPWLDNTCGICDKKGHVDSMCRRNGAAKADWGKAKQPATPDQATVPQTIQTKPVAVEPGASWVTYYCDACGSGIRDPDKVAKACPKCHKALPKKDGAAQPPQQQPSKLGLLTKTALELEERMVATNPGEDLPPTKAHQEATNKADKLKEHIAQLEAMEDPAFAEAIKARKQEYQKLITKIPQASQTLQDQATSLQTLAEIEEKRSRKEQALKDKLESLMEQTKSIASNGTKAEKELREQYEKDVKMLQENVQLRTANNQKEIVDVRAEIEAVEKEAKDRSAEIQKKAKLTAEAPPLNTLATTEGNVIAVPRGFIAHANDVSSQEMAEAMQGNLAGAGLAPEVAASLAMLMAQTSLNFIQSKSIHVGAPKATPSAASASAQVPTEEQKQQQQPLPQQQTTEGMEVDESTMTDLELSEEELEAAEASAKQGEIVRTTRRATRAEKAKVSTARTAKKVLKANKA